MTRDGILIRVARLIGKERTLRVLRSRNKALRARVAASHRLQQLIEWGLPPTPEWFDHYLDVYHQWHETQNPNGLERGIFNLLALKEQGRLLEICCGDGFNAYHFYSIRSQDIIAVDFDPQVIQHARRLNQSPNIRYDVCDIRTSLPSGLFDNIIWDMGIEHFTPVEIAGLLTEMKTRLAEQGTLSGCTIVEKATGKQLVHHEYEFHSKDDLLRSLAPHFRNVKVFETQYPTRHSLYFFASDGVLPFDADWASQAVSRSSARQEQLK